MKASPNATILETLDMCKHLLCTQHCGKGAHGHLQWALPLWCVPSPPWALSFYSVSGSGLDWFGGDSGNKMVSPGAPGPPEVRV